MKRLRNHLIGVDQGDVILFSDFEDGGEMWTGRGQRERRRRIAFAEPFRAAPSVQVSISMWDVDTETPLRADISAETVTPDGFDLVFRTWGDTRVARVRASWMALGEMRQADEWDLY
ncbi:MAG: H-type lectin domain-containing protein [Pseudomonadota bacterium]